MKKGLHPKLLHAIELLLLDIKLDLPYYGEFNQAVNFIEKENDPRIKTAGVNFTAHGMNHYYNPSFIDSLSQEMVNFLLLHETFHLLYSHPQRTLAGGYNHDLSNIAQDMIINSILVKDIKPSFITIPKNQLGENSALFVPKEYEGEWVFEILYHDLKKAKEESEKRRRKNQDLKIFDELFFKHDLPSLSTQTKSHRGELLNLNNVLISKSKIDSEKYMSNFARKCILILDEGQKIELYGYASSLLSDGKTTTDNMNLSIRRAELFKNAITEQIEDCMNIYAYCIVLINNEEQSLTIEQKIDYIIKFEEITNTVMVKQRNKELQDKTKEDQIDFTFKEYRFSELYKFDEKTLLSMTVKNNLTVPNVAQEKIKYIQLAQSLISTEGFSDNDKIITNDMDEQLSVLASKYTKVNRFKTFVNITDSFIKQEINQRVYYKLPENTDGGGMSGNSGYGANGANGEDCYGLDDIFDKMDDNNGEFFDQHMSDTIPEEVREQMVKDLHNRLKSRGLCKGNIEQTLAKLQKSKKDYLKEIKRGISLIKGVIKNDSIKKPNRRGITGLKGRKKVGSKITVLLDTSGSMGSYIEKALSFIFRSDIEVNLIQCDTEVQSVEGIKNYKQLEKVKIKGLGGTIIQPGVDYAIENFPQYNLLILTDGATDSLDFSKYTKQKVLIISNGTHCPISHANSKLKQIIVED